MKKFNLTFVFFLTVYFLSAQDYLVTFSGSGESTTVSTVIVDNMTQGKSLTLNGNDVLHLKSTVTEISDLVYNQAEGIHFYPNPMKEFSIMEFVMPGEGNTIVELFDISGRKLTQTQNYLNRGRHCYRITGVGKGMYVLKVTAGNYLYSGKLISDKETGGTVAITYQNTILVKDNLANNKSAKSEILMQYHTGDVLKFTATSGEKKSVKVEVISQSKKIEIPFYKCSDKDDRNYATVKIGTQVWMAENLAYLPSVSPSSSGSYTDPYYYVYGYKGTSVAAAKQNANYTTYGVLYNWYAAKAACPLGWHLPTNDEWTTLANFLGGEGAEGGKMKDAGTELWLSPNTGATNESGFSALPGGYRNDNGNFYDIIQVGDWWSSTEGSTIYAGGRSLKYNLSNLWLTNGPKEFGFSVRCVRD